jgi:hypothetical protein
MKTIALSTFLALTLCAAPARAYPPQLIREVDAASVTRTGPDTVVVCARGTVTTGGWTGARLTAVRRTGRAGVYDLDFTAVKPEGMATQMISPIMARLVWTDAPADLRGVKVNGLSGSALATLSGEGGC